MTLSPFGLDPRQIFINGEWTAVGSGETLPLTNPSDGSILCEIGKGGAAAFDG